MRHTVPPAARGFYTFSSRLLGVQHVLRIVSVLPVRQSTRVHRRSQHPLSRDGRFDETHGTALSSAFGLLDCGITQFLIPDAERKLLAADNSDGQSYKAAV